jgi:hypothetical protein
MKNKTVNKLEKSVHFLTMWLRSNHCWLFQLLGQILYIPQYGVLLLGVALKPLVGVVSSLAHFKFLCERVIS